MSNKTYAAKEHVGSDWKAPTNSTKNGLCLSGGGSRALSAGLGQLIGLKDSSGSNGSLLDSVDYISSVSGGTWLTSIFSFSENQNLDDLLGTYAAPNTLTEDNIGDLPAGSIGHAPSKLSYSSMIDIAHKKIGLGNIYKYPEVRKWIWAVIVGELVLKPYKLYAGTMEGSEEKITPTPKKFFSLSEAYMEENIKTLGNGKTDNGSLSVDDFYFHQSGRPFPIINTNIKVQYNTSDSALLPVQGTPIAIGATGTASQSGQTLTANGGVDSFAFASNWQSQTSDTVTVNVDRPYSLIDLVSCSSAFFAGMVGEKIMSAAAIFSLGDSMETENSKSETDFKDREKALLKNLSDLVPQYNYWPVGSSAPSNQNAGFADGGNLDNTGLLGMLARSDATNIVVCYNSNSPLGNKENIAVAGYDKKVAQISIKIPVLFGYQPKPLNGEYVLLGENPPADLNYLKAAQVFDPAEFGPLVSKLFAASNEQQSPTTARTDSLTVCDNPFAGIYSRHSVNILWIYNNYAENWVDEIHENSWKLADNIKYGRKTVLSEFHEFPNYSTAKTHLNATQVNALAQFQAWVIDQVSDQIADLFGVKT